MTDDITVLHVEDEGAYADLQKMYLDNLVDDDISTIITTDPGDALELIEERDVDCVICDYDMPNVDGLNVLGTVRERHLALPFILLTGKGNEEIASEAIRKGATDYVKKPSGSRQYKMLGNRIRNAVTQYRRQREDREEVERFRARLDRVTDPFFALDDDLRVTYHNEAVRRLVDCAPGSPRGAAIVDLLPGDDRLEAALRRSLREQATVAIRAPVEDDGGERDVRIYPDDGGLSVLVLGPGADDDPPS